MDEKILADIEDARRVAELEGCEMEGASLGDLMRQMAHKITEIEREARSMERQSDGWEDAHSKLQDAYDKLVDERAKEADGERERINDAVEDLCLGLGLPRRALMSTGIPELDKLIDLAL